ncbi:hypothetical protein HNQ60_000184 [Povalibacter uvarum]|uniref:Uncharacterized protein n=1 Tax=Povalibacter uvarum TaxID=732238 RepID=A0A841HGA8_9GAMM|nr:hypothetical protein [Povalibacter uvarum]MBB6091338.1 hypothetical protein [Povalibacter uvarum]
MNVEADGRSSETASSLRGGYGTTARFLSYLSAIWCGFVLCVLEVLWIGVFIYLVVTFFPLDELPSLAGAPVVMCVGAICNFALGIAFGRFLLRAMPPQPWDRTKIHQLIFVCALLVGIFCLVWWFADVIVTVFLFAEDVFPPAMEDAAVAVSRLFAILWAVGAVGPLILRHRRPGAFLHRPFVLVLRRFSTFADRTLVALILRLAKPGVPVVFLTPTRSRPKDWNPFVVGFAGLKLLHPLRSVPMVLRARDDDWQHVADELILRAKIILVDVSEGSTALRTEAEMIERGGRWSETVCLKHAPFVDVSDQDSFGGLSRGRCIPYWKSWTEALPRLVVSTAIILLVAPLPTMFLFYFWRAGWAPHTVVYIILVLISCSILWSPAVSRDARTELRRMLQGEFAAQPDARS